MDIALYTFLGVKLDTILAGVIGSVITLILTQGFAYIKYWWNKRYILIGLSEEFLDIQKQVQSTFSQYEEMMKNYSKTQKPTYYAIVPLSNTYSKTKLNEVFNNVYREKRIAYQVINALVDAFNNNNLQLGNYASEFYRLSLLKDEAAKIQLNSWNITLAALYEIAKTIDFEITWHTKHFKNVKWYRPLSKKIDEDKLDKDRWEMINTVQEKIRSILKQDSF